MLNCRGNLWQLKGVFLVLSKVIQVKQHGLSLPYMMKGRSHLLLKTDPFIWYNKSNTFQGTIFSTVMISPKKFVRFPLEDVFFFFNVINRL